MRERRVELVFNRFDGFAAVSTVAHSDGVCFAPFSCFIDQILDFLVLIYDFNVIRIWDFIGDFIRLRNFFHLSEFPDFRMRSLK